MEKLQGDKDDNRMRLRRLCIRFLLHIFCFNKLKKTVAETLKIQLEKCFFRMKFLIWKIWIWLLYTNYLHTNCFLDFSDCCCYKSKRKMAGQVDTNYVKSVFGILKILEFVSKLQIFRIRMHYQWIIYSLPLTFSCSELCDTMFFYFDD